MAGNVVTGEQRPDTLAVAELFHRTVQGEGPAAGRTASFLRLMGCNLSCSWCDSPFTWDASRFDLRQETEQLDAATIADQLDNEPGILVLTGGEPLLQQRRPAFRDLLDLMADRGRPVHIETNGTVEPTGHTLARSELIVVSPKLPNAGPHRGHQSPMIATGMALAGSVSSNVVLKVVVRDEDDVARAVEMADAIDWSRRRVWVMPEGTTVEALQARWPVIAAVAAKYGINASHRLHVLAWGDERGR